MAPILPRAPPSAPWRASRLLSAFSLSSSLGSAGRFVSFCPELKSFGLLLCIFYYRLRKLTFRNDRLCMTSETWLILLIDDLTSPFRRVPPESVSAKDIVVRVERSAKFAWRSLFPPVRLGTVWDVTILPCSGLAWTTHFRNVWRRNNFKFPNIAYFKALSQRHIPTACLQEL